MTGGAVAVSLLASTALFFFVVTRGALLVRGLTSGSHGEASHVYPIYSNMRLIKMVDFQPIISAILLFQYHRLVSSIVSGIRQYYKPEDLVGKHVIVVANLQPAVIRGVESKGMLLAASGNNDVAILQTIREVPPGSKVS